MNIFVNERNFTMNTLINTNRCLLSVCGLCFFAFAFISSNVEGSVPTIDLAGLLQSKGYPADTPEQIIEATRSRSYFVRYIALKLLTQRTGEKTIPMLKEALNDTRMEVRWRAAHLLGTLDDKSGLERMRRDLKEFAPKNGEPVPPDPNATHAREKKQRERNRNLRLGYAIHAAKVLAELGDRRGYELAVRMALNGPQTYHRVRAIPVLVEIAKTSKKVLVRENKDPEFILCAIAESEKDQRMFNVLTSSVERLGGDIAVRILERAIDSPHHSEKMRNLTKLRLQKVRAKIEGADNKRKD